MNIHRESTILSDGEIHRGKAASAIQNACVMIGRAFAVVSVIMVFEWAKNHMTTKKYLGGLNWDEKVFNYHPVLMVLGFLFFLSWAITSFRVTSLEKSQNKILHGIFHLGALSCVVAGLKAVWKSHDVLDSTPKGAYVANLYSLHSWIGIIAVVLFGQNYVLGLVVYALPILGLEDKKAYMPSHMTLGLLTFITAVVAMLTGIQEKQGIQGGCGYVVTEKDSNPSENYTEIPDGCKVSNGLGITIVITLLFTVAGMLRNPDDRPLETDRNTKLLAPNGRNSA